MDLSSSFNIPDDDTWDSSLYRNLCSFVPENGRELIKLLDPRRNERILDLGCGTGELSARIASSGATVVGVDSSPNMIEAARDHYPQVTFVEGDALHYTPDKPFDAVFSNAVFHWIEDHEALVKSVSNMLRQGGRFVAEFSAEGNIRRVRQELHRLLEEIGYDSEEIDPWYFPSEQEYHRILNTEGFEIEHLVKFNHTALLDGDEGFHLWLAVFGQAIFAPLTEKEGEILVQRLTRRLRDECFRNGQWHLDYHRLRFRALK